MIVDDQSFNIDALMIIIKYTVGLDSEKYCESALSGHQALKLVKDDIEHQKSLGGPVSSKYNLIFMDCSMPEMDGPETTEMIRAYLYEQNLEQPIISAVTGHQE